MNYLELCEDVEADEQQAPAPVYTRSCLHAGFIPPMYAVLEVEQIGLGSPSRYTDTPTVG